MIFPAVSELFKRFVASQLRKPSGWPIGWIMLDRLNRWNREMNRQSLARIDIQGGEKILELGCGGGGLLEIIADKLSTGKVIGLDWSPLAIRFCNNRLKRYVDQGRLDLICQNAEKIALPADSIDCICSVNTVYFWDTPEAVLVECARVLKTNGRIVLCNAVISELSPEDYPPEYFRSHAVEEVADRLQSLGFSKPEIDYGQDDHAKFYTLSATLLT